MRSKTALLSMLATREAVDSCRRMEPPLVEGRRQLLLSAGRREEIPSSGKDGGV